MKYKISLNCAKFDHLHVYSSDQHICRIFFSADVGWPKFEKINSDGILYPQSLKQAIVDALSVYNDGGDFGMDPVEYLNRVFKINT